MTAVTITVTGANIAFDTFENTSVKWNNRKTYQSLKVSASSLVIASSSPPRPAYLVTSMEINKSPIIRSASSSGFKQRIEGGGSWGRGRSNIYFAYLVTSMEMNKIPSIRSASSSSFKPWAEEGGDWGRGRPKICFQRVFLKSIHRLDKYMAGEDRRPRQPMLSYRWSSPRDASELNLSEKAVYRTYNLCFFLLLDQFQVKKVKYEAIVLEASKLAATAIATWWSR